MLFLRGVSQLNQYTLYAQVTLILAAGNQKYNGWATD